MPQEENQNQGQDQNQDQGQGPKPKEKFKVIVNQISGVDNIGNITATWDLYADDELIMANMQTQTSPENIKTDITTIATNIKTKILEKDKITLPMEFEI